ncbi:MAG: hypothetical protein H6581_09615 [Bacteroidia bacterium]|nr:hypothetical protein [Bacteroidia bacterium]
MNRSQNTFDARIYLNGETIHYFMEGNKFQFRIEEIRMIGEFSAEPGALGADYFFTFIVKGIKKPLDIPAYAEGLFEVLADLRGILGGLDHPRLQMSTDFQSNILFPAEMAGKPYYEFLPESKPAINLPFLRNMVQIESIGKKLSPYLNLN